MNERRQKLKARVTGLFQYFRDACERLKQMGQNWVDLGKGESLQAGYAHLDSIILACSYLDALFFSLPAPEKGEGVKG